jgi:CRISPR-associated protein Cas1
VDKDRLQAALSDSLQMLESMPDNQALMAEEARLTKKLFKLAAGAVDYGDFTRAKHGSGTDAANRFLDHGNYLAYGLAATATWVLGLPHGLAVLHGKTRRGGLVFDAADLIKDALILPQAFVSAMRGDDEQTFRQACIDAFAQTEALDFMIDTLKAIALDMGGKAP